MPQYGASHLYAMFILQLQFNTQAHTRTRWLHPTKPRTLTHSLARSLTHSVAHSRNKLPVYEPKPLPASWIAGVEFRLFVVVRAV